MHYLKVIDHVFSLVRRKFADTAVCGSFCVADSVLCEPFPTLLFITVIKPHYFTKLYFGVIVTLVFYGFTL